MNLLGTGKDFYGDIENVYSNSLNVEIAELQRKIYLPLLPLEKLTDQVLGAYRYNNTYYWTKEDKYTAMVGNFYIPMLTPLVENRESTEIINAAPKVNADISSSRYITSTYIELVIPRSIVLQFNNLIPKGTKFIVSFFGGNSRNDSIKILAVSDTVPIPAGEFDDSLYETYGMNFSSICSLVSNNLNKIKTEENRRRNEERQYANSKP